MYCWRSKLFINSWSSCRWQTTRQNQQPSKSMKQMTRWGRWTTIRCFRIFFFSSKFLTWLTTTRHSMSSLLKTVFLETDSEASSFRGTDVSWSGPKGIGIFLLLFLFFRFLLLWRKRLKTSFFPFMDHWLQVAGRLYSERQETSFQT